MNIVIGKEFKNGEIKYDTKSFNVKSFGELKESIKIEKEEQFKTIKVYILDKDMNILKFLNK